MYNLQIIRDLAEKHGFNYTENEPLRRYNG